VQTYKAKQGFGYVESDEISEVTPTRQNCDQTQWKGLNIKSAISVNVDVFNRRFVTQFPKVALDYFVNLSRYCPTKFYSDLRFLETYSHSVQNTHFFYVGLKFTDSFVFTVGTLHFQSNYLLWGYYVRQRSYKQNVYIFHISFVMESFIFACFGQSRPSSR
jgi:hypothetical protein